MAVGQSVHTENHTREVDVHTCVVAAHKTTTPMRKMGPETVEGGAKHRDVESMADMDALPVEQNDGSAPPQDRSKGIVTHSNAEVPNRFVRDEGRTVRDHVVRCTGVCHDQSKALHKLLGGDSLEQSRHKARRKDDIVRQRVRIQQG